MKQANKVLSQMHQQVSNLYKLSHYKTLRNILMFFFHTASGEDPQCSTPKSSRKSSVDQQYNQNHLPLPNASPGGPHLPHGANEDYEMGASPQQWPGRTPASPVSYF